MFKQLFLQGSPTQVAAQIRKLDTGRSILDTVAGQAKELQRSVPARDRDRLDQYFTSVRDLEHRLQASRGWENKPKPVVNAPMPIDPANPAAYMDKVKIMYDLARLAFETDSTRAITLMLDSVSTPVLDLPDANISDGYHNLSHHGKSEAKRSQLQIIDHWHMKLLGNLIADLKSMREGEDTLLDRTMVLYGSNFGDANAHTCFNMPTILAGGGFKHGQHLAFDTRRNYPLPNLYVSMLQRMGIESDRVRLVDRHHARAGTGVSRCDRITGLAAWGPAGICPFIGAGTVLAAESGWCILKPRFVFGKSGNFCSEVLRWFDPASVLWSWSSLPAACGHGQALTGRSCLSVWPRSISPPITRSG